MAEERQSYQNHARVIPLLYRIALIILVVNLIWTVFRLVRSFRPESVVAFLLALALPIILFYARGFALTVQDRVIRLEMNLRLERILPSELRSRMNELTIGQLVSLRFAGDAEMPDLVRKVLDGPITDRKAIKQMIQDWQPDHLRA